MTNIHSITSHMGKTEASLCADVVQFLELWLEKARAGEIIAATVIAEAPDGRPMTGHTVAAPSFQTIGVLEVVKIEMLDAMAEDAE
jgi:hypothetical protein